MLTRMTSLASSAIEVFSLEFSGFRARLAQAQRGCFSASKFYHNPTPGNAPQSLDFTDRNRSFAGLNSGPVTGAGRGWPLVPVNPVMRGRVIHTQTRSEEH